MREYVELRQGGYYIAATRIPLEGIIYQFHQGASPESIRQELPALTLEQIYGAITYYLANQAEIHEYVLETERLVNEARTSANPLPSDLRERLNRTRNELHLKRP